MAPSGRPHDSWPSLQPSLGPSDVQGRCANHWHYGYPETDGGAASCRGSGRTTACDEWPWQATEQGGQSGVPLPHLKIIDWRQNSVSGARYGGFVSTCKLAERKTLPTPLNGGGNFLVIPVSKGAPSTTPSLSLCHGTNP